VGCNLGEDCFSFEEDIEPTPETLCNSDEHVLDVGQGEVDALVNDLNDVWCPTEAKHKEGSFTGLENHEERECIMKPDDTVMIHKQQNTTQLVFNEEKVQLCKLQVRPAHILKPSEEAADIQLAAAQQLSSQ